MGAPIAITMGEPSGVGGEIAIAAWRSLRRSGSPFFLLDDPARLAALADHLGDPVPVETIAEPREAPFVFPRALPVLALSHPVPLSLGAPLPKSAPAVIEAIELASRLTAEGRASALVTNPINKASLKRAGFSHPGHTEFLSELAGGADTVMMLAGKGLRVVPVTIHIPLSEVAGALTTEKIVTAGRILHRALRRDFAVSHPRIAVAGLNPHAGEEGSIGHEDQQIVRPAVNALRAGGIDAVGPLPADTMFHERARARYDAALCMYHDQALVPLKTLAFDEGVNVTLGLPFVRTSPDHGTALDIAGQGVARPDSLIASIELAADIAARRAQRVVA